MKDIRRLRERFPLHFYNTEEEIDKLIDEL